MRYAGLSKLSMDLHLLDTRKICCYKEHCGVSVLMINSDHDNQLIMKERRKFNMEKKQIMSKVGDTLFRQGLISLQEKQKFDELLNHR